MTILRASNWSQSPNVDGISPTACRRLKKRLMVVVTILEPHQESQVRLAFDNGLLALRMDVKAGHK